MSSAGRPRTAVPPQAGQRAYWFPLLLFGGLAALSLPLSGLVSPPQQQGIFLVRVVYPTVAEAMYLGGGTADELKDAFPPHPG